MNANSPERRNLFEHPALPVLFLPAAFLFLLIYSWTTSPLYLMEGDDSATFKIIGLGLLQGKLPYTDLFDHKGPVLFFIQALGLGLIPGKWGLFLLQTVNVSVALYLMFRSACLFTDRRKAFFATLLTLVPFVDFIKEGNQCEEWMLPWIAGTLYLALSYFVRRKECPHPVSRALFYGICCGVLFFIRPNDAVSQTGAVMTGIFVHELVCRRWHNALFNALSFGAGCLLIAVPVFLFFLGEGTVPDMLFGTIGYNLTYASDAPLTSASAGIFLVPLIFCGTLIVLGRREKQPGFLYLFLPMLVFTLILIGKRDYYSYLIVLLPTVCVFFANALERQWKRAVTVLCLLFAVFSYRQHRILFRYAAEREEMAALYEESRELIRTVPEAERNEIWNDNLYHRSDERNPYIHSLLGIYLYNGITPGNRVFIDFHLPRFGAEERLPAHNPRWVLYAPASRMQDDAAYLEQHYAEVARTSADSPYEIRLYRRNGETAPESDR